MIRFVFFLPLICAVANYQNTKNRMFNQHHQRKNNRQVRFMNFHTNAPLEQVPNTPKRIRADCSSNPLLLKNQADLAERIPECSSEARRLQKARLDVSQNHSSGKTKIFHKLVDKCSTFTKNNFSKNADQRAWNLYCLNFVENSGKITTTDRSTNGFTNVYRRHISN